MIAHFMLVSLNEDAFGRCFRDLWLYATRLVSSGSARNGLGME
jgi:hypothetical protein